jgi:hypothetical protein
MTPEGKVKAEVKKYLATLGAWYTMPAGTGFGSSGVPDFLVCHQGRFVGIETKAPGKIKNTTTMQERQLQAISAAGGRSIVIDDVSQLEGVF